MQNSYFRRPEGDSGGEIFLYRLIYCNFLDIFGENLSR